MSFTSPPPPSLRLNRSELAVPASQPRMIEKAAQSAADVVFLDLEDSVAPDDKEQARSNAIEALHDLEWPNKSVSVRINGLDTHFMYRDVVDVLEKAGDKLDMIMVPKVGTAADVYAIDMLATQIETAKGFKRRVGLELQIESAMGMQNVDAIAAASPRNESLHFGSGDFAASIAARITTIGGVNPNYTILTDVDAESGARETHWQDMWHYALSRIVIAARANGLRPIDGPLADFSDAEGFRAAALRAASLGCEGKWAIHPSQIELANEAMGPDPKDVTQSQRILDALAEASREGRGAVTLDGRMIDAASIRQAEVMVAKAKQIGLL